MPRRNALYRVSFHRERQKLYPSVVTAIRSNSKQYLNPPISNLSYRGIEKTSNEIIKWFDRSKDVKTEFATLAMIMERAGTGGALFRNIYRDFLKEASELTGDSAIGEAHKAFIGVAQSWSDVIALFEQVGETGEREYVLRASEKLKALAAQERAAMQLLEVV